MVMTYALQQLINEKKELDSKINNILYTIDKTLTRRVDYYYKELRILKQQVKAMERYSYILGERIFRQQENK